MKRAEMFQFAAVSVDYYYFCTSTKHYNNLLMNQIFTVSCLELEVRLSVSEKQLEDLKTVNTGNNNCRFILLLYINK